MTAATLRWAVAFLGVVLAIVAALIVRDNSRFRMAQLELRKARAERDRAKARSHRLREAAAESERAAQYHRDVADQAAVRAEEIENEVQQTASEVLADMPDSERVRRFKERIGIGSG